MARYEIETSLSTSEVVARAERFFGKRGLGLLMTEDTETAISWRGGGGTVSVTIMPGGRRTCVEVASTEWDAQVRRFLRHLRGPVWDRWRRAVRM